MRAHARASALCAALVAAPIALIAPSAQAAASASHLVATASCRGGGTVHVSATLDAAGTAKAVAKVSGVHAKHWKGEVVAGATEEELDGASFADIAKDTYHAPHGRFSATATRADATTVGTAAVFASPDRRAMCAASVMPQRTQFVLMGTEGGLFVGAGIRSAVGVDVFRGIPGHHYRARFSLATEDGPVQRRTVERTGPAPEPPVVATSPDRRATTDLGDLHVMIRDFKHLPSLTHVSVKVVDLTDRSTPPLTFSIGH
jgi:hypothetical protein